LNLRQPKFGRYQIKSDSKLFAPAQISITGGYQYEGKRADLKGKYIFGDFGTGRIWAVNIPKKDGHLIPQDQWLDLGQWTLNISSFGKDRKGNVYVLDFSSRALYKVH
jgi:hypothetical protein